MALRAGYKHSEAGVIPEDWEITKLGSHTSLITKGTTPTSVGKSFRAQGINFLKAESIDNSGGVIRDKLAFIDEETYRLFRRSQLAGGDILFSIAGVLGRVGIISSEFLPANTNQALAIIRLREGVCLATDFLFHSLRSRSITRQVQDINVQAAQANLSLANVGNLWLPLPTKAEQEAIAAVLSDADALIASIEQLIQKKRRIKQGAMQVLLTGKQRLPGFETKPGTQQTEVGVIPQDWEVVRFGSFASIRNNKVLATAVPPDTLCVELDHVEQNTGHLATRSRASASTSSKYRFGRSDVLFGRLRSYLRKFWLADSNGICTTEIWPLLVEKAKGCSAFLFYVVQTDSFIKAASISYGTHMPRTDWKVISDLRLPIPPKAEQQAIADVLSDMDAEMEALQTQRDKARQVKQGMMQALLTGRIRLL